MARGKTKSKAGKAAVANKDVIDMFSNMLGIGDDPNNGLNTTIIYDKVIKLKTAYKRYIKLFDLLEISNSVKKHTAINKYLLDYIELLKSIQTTLFANFRELTEIGLLQITCLSKEDQDNIKNVYTGVKDSKLSESIIVTCKNLVEYKRDIGDNTNLSDKFLLKLPGLQFCPVYGADGINFKLLYCDATNSDKDKEYLLTILHKLYIITHEVYQVISSPDIDVDEFVDIIISSVSDIRSKIPRCDAAFNKIIESVDLLKSNFGDYYKDYVASNNPTSIMENFIIDVSEKTDATPQLTNQFRKIISYYRKVASQQSSNPKLAMLFKHIDKNFEQLDKTFKTDTPVEEEVVIEIDDSGTFDTEEPLLEPLSISTGLSDISLDIEEILTPSYAKSPILVSVTEPDSPNNLSNNSDDFKL